jgi:hypothetical protein
MNNIIVSRGKEIIICLLIIIFILLFLLSKGNSLDSKPFDPRVSNANLNNFIDLLFDPKENVHGVLLLAPGRQSNLTILNYRLEPTKPCDNGQLTSVNTVTKGEDIPPPECLEGGRVKVDLESQRIITITHAVKVDTDNSTTVYAKKGEKSIVFLHDADPRWVPLCGQGGTQC